MIEQEYIEPGRYQDKQGGVVTVTGRLDPNGRHEVIYADDSTRGLYTAQTIKQVYRPLALAVAVLACLPALAFGAVAKHSTLTRAQTLAAPAISHALIVAQANAQTIEDMTVNCTGTTKHVVCIATGPGAVAGSSNTGVLARATFTVSGGIPRLVKITIPQNVGAV